MNVPEALTKYVNSTAFEYKPYNYQSVILVESVSQVSHIHIDFRFILSIAMRRVLKWLSVIVGHLFFLSVLRFSSCILKLYCNVSRHLDLLGLFRELTLLWLGILLILKFTLSGINIVTPAFSLLVSPWFLT